MACDSNWKLFELCYFGNKTCIMDLIQWQKWDVILANNKIKQQMNKLKCKN